MQLGNTVIIAVQHSGQKACEKQSVGEVQLSHNTEINGDERTVSCNEDVAWMHIGMKKTVTKDLVEKTAGCNLGDLANVMTGSLQRSHIIDANAVDPFDHQHFRCGVFKVNPWHIYASICVHIVGQLAGSSGLEPQIKLHFRNQCELVNGGYKFQAAQIGRDPFHNACQRIEQACIRLHPPTDAGSQQLYRNLPPIQQPCRMHLCN